MQKSLDFYTTTLGLQILDTPVLKDGNVVQASVGFESPLLILLTLEDNQTSHPEEYPARNKPGAGVEFCIHMNGSRRFDEFSAGMKARGVTTIDEQRTELRNESIVTLTDPDGYAFSFGKSDDYIAQQRAWVSGGEPKRSAGWRRHFISIFSTH